MKKFIKWISLINFERISDNVFLSNIIDMKKSSFELQKMFYNRHVRVVYDYSEKLFRLDGIVLSGETNINVWLIRNGWSFYLLGEDPPPGHQEFLAAESEAREKQVGLWKAELQKD